MGATKERELLSVEFREPVNQMSIEDWMAKGKELFGEDPKRWKFKCACCGHVQTIGDFIELRDLGLWDGDAGVAYYNCIGRYDSRIPEKELGKLDGKGKSPCDYTLGGLISLAKTIVVDGDGNEHKVFEFAEGLSKDAGVGSANREK